MSRRDAVEDQPSGDLARRFFVTLLVLAVLAYLAALLVGRTDGFRHMVEQRLGERWSLPVRVEQVRLLPDGSLRLRGLTGGAVDGPGMTIEEARVSVSLPAALVPGRSPVRRVGVREGSWIFRRDDGGDWQPAAFAGDAAALAARLGLDPPGPLPAVRFTEAGHVLQLAAVDARWEDVDAVPLVAIQGLSLDTARSRLLDREFRYERITAGPRSVEQLWIDDQPVPLPASGL